jgi:hypothetical protein
MVLYPCDLGGQAAAAFLCGERPSGPRQNELRPTQNISTAVAGGSRDKIITYYAFPEIKGEDATA